MCHTRPPQTLGELERNPLSQAYYAILQVSITLDDILGSLAEALGGELINDERQT